MPPRRMGRGRDSDEGGGNADGASSGDPCDRRTCTSRALVARRRIMRKGSGHNDYPSHSWSGRIAIDAIAMAGGVQSSPTSQSGPGEAQTCRGQLTYRHESPPSLMDCGTCLILQRGHCNPVTRHVRPVML
eukprot:227833-Chlamydomonas_euryale.AAC.2